MLITLLLAILVLVRLSVWECALGGGLGVMGGEICTLSVRGLGSSSEDTSCSNSHSSLSTDMTVKSSGDTLVEWQHLAMLVCRIHN